MRFVVHKHSAKKLHWDLRLELDGVLKSWAVPKEPSVKTAEKRLAISVDDHNLDYIDFEGEILEGYGKGTVEIWDRGNFDIESRKEEKFVLIFNGEKLKGRYTLVKMNPALSGKTLRKSGVKLPKGKGTEWLFFKSKEK